MTNMTSVTTVIAALGGNQEVAALTHSEPKAVSGWKATGKFPAATYVAMQAKLKKMGLYAPDNLWGMRATPKVPHRKWRR